ncbi:MAG: hypothetical protein PF545_00465, partial [Elusimicrobia bacterium]|nr:hypothetical protein [Elusimicrobiota bacterium]
NSYKNFLNEHPVFTLDEYIKEISRNKSTAYNNLMKSYISKGKVKSIKRGLYAVVPSGSNSDSFKADEILIASRLADDAVLAFHSALEVMGYNHNVFYRHYYYTDNPKRKIKINNFEYVSVKTPIKLKNISCSNQGIESIEYNNLKIMRTNRERTFVDCLNKPDYVGGMEELYRSIEKYPYLDFERVLKYLDLFDSKVLYARVGFFLGQHKKKFFVEDNLLDELKAKIPSSVVYFTPGRKKGQLVKKWNLIVPEKVKEKEWEEFQE